MRISLLLFGLMITACSQANLPPEPENLCENPDARCVSAPVRDVLAVDGDTFELQRLTDRGTERIRLRLIGWDSPETGISDEVFDIDDYFNDPNGSQLGQYSGRNIHARWKQAQAWND